MKRVPSYSAASSLLASKGKGKDAVPVVTPVVVSVPTKATKASRELVFRLFSATITPEMMSVS